MDKIEQLQNELLKTGKSIREDDSVPYAFEQRIMAQLRQATQRDTWANWSMALWRGLAPCLGIAILTITWFVMNLDSMASSPTLEVALEDTLAVPVSTDTDLW